jgi:signal transduction histidine kinase
LALLQTVLLIAVLAIAGSLTKFSVKVIYRHEVQTRILGEAGAMTALDRDKGAAAVARVIAQNERRPDGLEYRLEGPDGRALSDDLPRTGAPAGWTYLDWDDAHVPGRPFQDLLVYTQKLPDGATLTIGQDLSEESKLRHALKHVLFWCGAIGAAIGLIASILLGRGGLRRVQGIVGAARAVSGGQMQVRAPTRAAWLPDDIDELGATFNSMLDALDTLVGRLRWVSADIAHDLRTPLTHVKQKLELMRRAADTPPATAAACKEIDRDIDELLRTLDAMLRLAEIENDRHAARFEPVDLADLAGRVIDAYRPDLEHSGRRLETRLEPASVSGDADLIAQAMGNLIENALRHTPPGSSIAVGVAQGAGRSVFSVTDDGPGIPLEEREAVLQRFHRLETSRTTPGCGLGLSIIAAIAKRHDASLQLTDAGPGLRATLVFPAG